MVRLRSWKVFIIFAVFLSVFPIEVCRADDKESEAEEITTVEQESTKAETTTVAAEIKTTAAPTNEPAVLDETTCMKKRKGCCDKIFLDDEDDLMKCFTLHQSKMPEENDKNPAKVMKFLSCVVECVYKQKKFVAKGDNVNMKMVKAFAKKNFANRPKEMKYYIEVFDFCRKDALTKYNLLKFNPAGRLLMKDACKPFFIFVFLCDVVYHQKHGCPYFRWEGEKGTLYEESCRDAKEKCYEVDGITI